MNALTARCLDRYERDDADTLRIELAAAGSDTPERRAAMLEDVAEAHREAARRRTAEAWELRRPAVCEEGDGW